ncbi:MAG: biotin--[acetyl-CoA-carboxylase] ligase [Planctomycetota bacterium]|jgi:biotin-[acetyl-CoA-carboxylase] ligase BirA-like protein|nr:biotin--[acetyl-CoA-carboxylase] ligase [Planctomycetota bacterium]
MPISIQLKKLTTALPASRIFGNSIEVIANCPSTNDELKQRISAGLPADQTLLLCNHQTSGRGRSARDWWSGAAGENLSFSLGLKFEGLPPHIVGLIGACAVANVVQRLLPRQRLAIKWPNDIMINDKKAAGFLCELPAATKILVLGLGLNVGTKPTAETVGYATSCIADFRPNLTPTQILVLWMFEFEKMMLCYSTHGSSNFENCFLDYLKAWAPNGVRIPTSEKQGALLKFSVTNGLTIGTKAEHFTQKMETISRLEKLNDDT